MRAPRDTWLNPALALLLCAGGGGAMAWLSLPLPWIIGPMSAMALANFGGAALRAPGGGRQLGQVIIGAALGLLYFTPAVAREVAAAWPLLVAAALLALLVAWACACFLARFTATDPATAYFASVPGGANEMVVAGERCGARADRVALAQSLRVLIVVIVVPYALTYGGVVGTDAYRPESLPLHPARLGILLAIAGAAGWALALTGAPNPFMLGALGAVIALTALDMRFSSMPGWMSNAGQLLLGCALGARFERRSLESMPRYVAGVLASVFLALGLAALAGIALARLAGLAGPTLILATAPGGIAEMCITAQALQLGVPLVTAAHVTRVIVLVSTSGSAFRLARRWFSLPPPRG